MGKKTIVYIVITLYATLGLCTDLGDKKNAL